MRVIVLLLLVAQPSLAQKYSLEKSKVVFFSDAAIEDIHAENIKKTGNLRREM